MSIRPASRIRQILHMTMAACYAFMGIALLTFWTPEGLPVTNKSIIGGVLIAYSIYRFWRLQQSHNEAIKSPDETN
ncbi:MAG: hypothetical protein ACKOQ6_07670 [Bacteroidota bacterium]